MSSPSALRTPPARTPAYDRRVGRTVVVGGGIVGASAAYHLAAAGRDVVLVDRADVGQATAAGAGIVAPGLSTTLPATWLPLAFAAAADYPRLLSELAEVGQDDLGYETVGLLQVALGDGERARLPSILGLFEERRRNGVANIGELGLLAAPDARRLFPPLAPDCEAIHASGAARVDGRRLRDGLVAACERLGGRRLPGHAEIRVGSAGVEWVDVSGARIDADEVVLACGAWTDALRRAIGVELGLEPQRGQILHLDVPDAATTRWPIVYGFASYYMLPFAPRRVVVGATREDGVGFDHCVTATGQHELLSRALAFAPGLATAAVMETRVGFRPATRDGLPLIGPVPGCEGLFLASGLGSFGLTAGPFAGALVAACALGAEPAIDLAPYRPDR